MSTPTPETPDTPQTTDLPEQPDRPSTPDIPDMPQSPEVPDAPGPTVPDPTVPDPTVPDRPDGRPEHSLAEEVFVDDGRTRPLPAHPGPTAPAGTATLTAPAPAAAHTPAPTPVGETTYLKGPAPFALVLGLLGLLVAGAVLLNELADVSLPWDDLGPWSVVAAGVVVLLVGAIGLRSSRAGRD